MNKLESYDYPKKGQDRQHEGKEWDFKIGDPVVKIADGEDIMAGQTGRVLKIVLAPRSFSEYSGGCLNCPNWINVSWNNGIIGKYQQQYDYGCIAHEQADEWENDFVVESV